MVHANARFKNRKKTFKKVSLLRTLFIGLIILLGASGLIAALVLIQNNQDIRQEAASCSYGNVDVQFRVADPKDATAWITGDSFTSANTNKIVSVDVNCFASNGSQLLPNGSYKVTLNGKTVTIPSSAKKSPTEIRNWKPTQTGTYVFTCSSGSSCSNSDSIKINKVAATPTPVPTPTPTILPVTSPSPTASPTTAPTASPICDSLADVNKDCEVNLLDYDLFLAEFIKRFKKPL